MVASVAGYRPREIMLRVDLVEGLSYVVLYYAVRGIRLLTCGQKLKSHVL